MTTFISKDAAVAACDAICDLPDAGSGAGYIRIYDGAIPASVDEGLTTQQTLATITLAATAFGASVIDDTVATADAAAMTADSSASAGTAAFFRVLDSSFVAILQGTCGTADADMIMDDVEIAAGANVACTAFEISFPHGGGADYGYVTFDAPFRSSLSNLSQTMTINGTDGTLEFAYYGKDADASSWDADVGTNAAAVGTGQGAETEAPTSDPADFAVESALTSEYYDPGGTATAYANMGSDDVVFEIVARTQDAGATDSYWLRTRSTYGYQFTVKDTSVLFYASGVGAASLVSAGSLSPSTWYHFLFFWDASGSLSAYVNGLWSATSGAGVSPVDAGTVDNGYAVRIAQTIYPMAYVAMWKGSGWLDTHLQPVVAQQRFQALTGLVPDYAAGTALAESLTAGAYAFRDSVAYVEKYDSVADEVSLMLVGKHWPRCERWKDSNDDIIEGIHQEYTGTNMIDESEDISAWTVRGTAAVTSDSIASPDGSRMADLVSVATKTNDVYITTSGGVNDGDGFASLYVKRSDTTGDIVIENPSDAARGAWTVDLSALPDKWTRLTSSHPAVTESAAFVNSSAGNGGILIYAASAKAIYIWGAQYEESGQVTSYIPTAGAVATRAYDYVRYAAEGNWPSGDSVSVTCDSYGQKVGGYVFSVSNGVTTPYLGFQMNANYRFVTSLSGYTGYSISAYTDVMSTDEIHQANLTIKDATSAAMLLDGVSAVVDTDSDVGFPKPTVDVNRLNIARVSSTAGQHDGLIGNLVIRKKYDEDPPA